MFVCRGLARADSRRECVHSVKPPGNSGVETLLAKLKRTVIHLHRRRETQYAQSNVWEAPAQRPTCVYVSKIRRTKEASWESTSSFPTTVDCTCNLALAIARLRKKVLRSRQRYARTTHNLPRDHSKPSEILHSRKKVLILRQLVDMALNPVKRKSAGNLLFCARRLHPVFRWSASALTWRGVL